MIEVLNIADVGFYNYLSDSGLCSNNCRRVNEAMSQLHSAVCKMDMQQLKQFKSTEFGERAVQLCTVYGITEPITRSDF